MMAVLKGGASVKLKRCGGKRRDDNGDEDIGERDDELEAPVSARRRSCPRVL
jgi:hypothetical protein